MELFDVIDSKGNLAGQIVSREKAHAEGIPHRTAHIWIVRKKEGKVQLFRCCADSQFFFQFPKCRFQWFVSCLDVVRSYLKSIEKN